MAYLLTKSAFARQCGVSAAAITKGIKSGKIGTSKDGKRVDVDSGTTQEYMKAHSTSTGSPEHPSVKNGRKGGKTPPGGLTGADVAAVESDTVTITKLEAETRRITAQTVKLNRDIAKDAGRFILREKVSVFFARLASVVSSRMLPMGQRIAGDICDKLGVDDPEKKLAVQEIIDIENERIIGEFKRVMSDAD